MRQSGLGIRPLLSCRIASIKLDFFTALQSDVTPAFVSFLTLHNFSGVQSASTMNKDSIGNNAVTSMCRPLVFFLRLGFALGGIWKVFDLVLGRNGCGCPDTNNERHHTLEIRSNQRHSL